MEDKEVKFHEEVQKMEYEPMDETELKLIKGGITLGIVLLVVLFVVSKYLLPGSAGGAVPHQQVRDDHPLDLGLLNT